MLASAIAQEGSGAPAHSAPRRTLYWDYTNKKLYVNNDGATSWTVVGALAEEEADKVLRFERFY